MGSNSPPDSVPGGTNSQAGERRKSLRFDIRFSAFLRVPGETWTRSETVEVSAAGASFVTNLPFLLNTPVEYVLALPPDLTKAQRHLRLRFHGTVLRCERIGTDSGTFGVSVRNTSHRYLSADEATLFETLEQ